MLFWREMAGSVPSFVRELDVLIRAHHPLVHIASWEGQRLDAMLEELARNHAKTLCTWSSTHVLRKNNRTSVELDGPQAGLRAALGLTLSEADNAFAKTIARQNRHHVEEALGKVKIREFYLEETRARTGVKNR